MPRKKINPWFKAESNAVVAIDNSRSTSNWSNLSVEIENLALARAEKAKAARNGKSVKIIQNHEQSELVHGGGRYLVQPPLVGRDAALLENRLKSASVSSVVVCREPVTSLGFCPVVALGSGVIVRVHVEEPKNPKKPTCAWFDHAVEELGDHVLEQLNQDSPIQRQLDYLLAHFSAVPTYQRAYHRAIDLCNTLSHESV